MISTAELLPISRTVLWRSDASRCPEGFTAVYEGYAAALEHAPLDGDTRRAYDSRIRGYLVWLPRLAGWLARTPASGAR